MRGGRLRGKGTTTDIGVVRNVSIDFAINTDMSVLKTAAIDFSIDAGFAPRTNYVETKWGSTDGVFPSSILTKRWLTTNETVNACASLSVAEDDYVMAMEWSVDGLRFNSYDASTDGNAADVETLSRFRLEGTTRKDWEYINVLRGSGSNGSETGYFIGTHEEATNNVSIACNKYVAGTGTYLGTSGDILFGVGTEWLWMRLRVNGTSIKGRIWRDGEIEPSTWHLDITDSAVTAEGWNGFGSWNDSLRCELDYYSVGTGGDTAPLTVSTNTVLRSTTTAASVLRTFDDPVTRVTTVSGNVLRVIDNPVVRTSTVNASVLYNYKVPGEPRIHRRRHTGFYYG